MLNGRVYDTHILTGFEMASVMLLQFKSGIIFLNNLFPICTNLKCPNFNTNFELLEDKGIKTIIRYVEIKLTEETLGIILGLPVTGVHSIEGCKPTGEFTKLSMKPSEVKCIRLPKKYLKGEYWFTFEFLNKVLVSGLISEL